MSNKGIRYCIAVLWFLSVSFISFSQSEARFSKEEYELIALFKNTNRFQPDSVNELQNKRILFLLDSILKIPESFSYNFSDLPISKLTAPDNSFKIFTWNVIHSSGKYSNYGFIQRINTANNTVKVYALSDKKEQIKTPLMQDCKPTFWYGAMYYDILKHTYKNQTFYTLLGWNANTTYTQVKVIETLKFGSGDVPMFGIPMIELKGKGFQKRMVFEYSAKTSMMMRYDKSLKLLVFDHLAPSSFEYTNIYEFYGPDFSVDAYEYKKGKWRYKADVETKNDRQGYYDYLPEKWRKKIIQKRTEKDNMQRITR